MNSEQIAALHSQTIPYNAIKLRMPNRAAFVSMQEIDKTKPLMFLPTYLMETHMQDEKYAKAVYKIILMGILQDGSRVNVILDGITPYFEIQLPDTRDEQEAELNNILELLQGDAAPTSTSIINAKPFKYYRKTKTKFLRLYYTKLKSRVAAIKTVRQHGYQTTSDDVASYYRAVCRDNLTTFSSWSVLTDYKTEPVAMLKADAFRVNIKNYKQFNGELSGDLLKDKTMSCCWDIETWSKDGDVPVPDNKNDNIFCLSMTFQWVHEKDPFFKVCLCDYPAAAKPGYLTIICGSEKNIIRGFAEIFELMSPEFIFGFNDSDYDWNWVIKRASHMPGLLSYIASKLDSTVPYQPYTDANVLKYNFKKEHVKVEADTYIDGFALQMNGYIPVDVRTIFRRLYPTAEQSSLKWFLSKNKLGGKEDMPYEEMFKIYREYREFMTCHASETQPVLSGSAIDLQTSEWSPDEVAIYTNLKKRLTDINYYCVIDAQRCHDLMKMRSVVMDHREVSNLSYCSVYDAFYRANGMKVRNLTIAVGQGKYFGIRFSNINEENAEEGKYPGAFVLAPKKGLKITKLSMPERVRKAELTQGTPRPAYQEWLNTTPDEILKYFNIIEEHGAHVTDIPDEFKSLPKKFIDFWAEPIGRPITGLDFSSLYPSLIRAYNFSPEYCILDKDQAKEIAATGQQLTKVVFEFQGSRKVAYFVWHNNKYDPTTDGFQFGVYPFILDDLFKKRNVIKKQMKKFDHRKEEIEALPPAEQDKLTAEYDDTVFQCNYLKSKQNALKVFMNTFYGEAGNKRSPFFVVEVAGGITSYGQKNIHAAYTFVKESQCNIYYSDTDSIYLSIPEKFFNSLDKQFYTGQISKLDYWTKCVEISFKEIDAIQHGVNKMFVEQTKTAFLSMAYEEILYPVAFTAKKKYFGIAHENIANFKPKDLFIRGLEVKKRGVSELLRKIFMELMWAACSADNVFDLVELVLTKIDEIYSRKWASADFIQTGVYRPTKNNVKIKTFVANMKARGIIIKPNERFNYVIVKKYPFTYDLRGRKVPLSIGDKLELVAEFEKNGSEIDLDYYMQGSINGQLARLITYHDMFKVEPLDDSAPEAKIAEDRIYKNACKFIESYCEKYYASYNTFGKAHQKIFKTASKSIVNTISNKDAVIGDLLGANVNFDDFEEWFIGYADKLADKSAIGHGQRLIKQELARIKATVLEKYTVAEQADEDKEEHEANVDKVNANRVPASRVNAEIKQRQNERLIMLQNSWYAARNAILTTRELNYKNTMTILRSKLREQHQNFIAAYSKYNNTVMDVMRLIKTQINMVDELLQPTSEAKDYTLDDFDANINETELTEFVDAQTSELLEDKEFWKSLTALKTLYYNMVSAHVVIKRTRDVVSYLKATRDRVSRIIVRPDASTIERMRQEDAQNIHTEITELDL